MITTGTMLGRLALKLDTYTTLVLVGLVVYVVALTGQYQGDAIIIFLADSAIMATISGLAGMMLRKRRIDAVMRALGDAKADPGRVKGAILSVPRYEAWICVGRWLVALTLVPCLLVFQVTLVPMNIISVVVVIPIIIPITYIIFYVTTENIVAVLLEDERIRDAQAPSDSYRPFTLVGRILLLVIAIALIPLGILGFFLYLVNARQLQLDNFGLHILMVILLSAAAVAISLYEMARNTRRGIVTMTAALESIQKGDLAIETVTQYATNELGALSRTVNGLRARLYEVIANVQQAATMVDESSDNISQAAQGLSSSASEQAAGIEEISSTIEEIVASVGQIADNSSEAQRLAGAAYNLSNEGTRVVGQAVDSINEINASSKRIAEIITLINDIAFQTNLLALNAAVEAARAGEHGRGFAVVAGEVRNLAMRSRSASDDIAKLIKTSVEKVDTGTRLANQSGTALKEIFEGVSRVRQIVDEIKVAGDEQKAGLGQITAAVSQTDRVTQQNAAAAEELSTTAEQLRENAAELKRQVNYFRI